LFDGKSKLPAAKVAQRIHNIKYTTPAAIAGSAIWVSLSFNDTCPLYQCDSQAIWLLSSDTQLGSGGEGDETQIDYKLFFRTFLRQICEGLRNKAEWAVQLFRFWDDVLFPNTEHSLGQTTSANHQAVGEDINAMDEAFRAAAQRREDSPVSGPLREQSLEPSPHPPVRAHRTPEDSLAPGRREPTVERSPPPPHTRGAGNSGRRMSRRHR
jgi:hypothetical protein